VQLAFFFRPINIQRPMMMYQPSGIRGCRTWCECFSNNCFVLTSKQSFTTQCGQAWKLKHVFPFRTERWRKIHSWGLSKQYRKNNFEVSQFLKKIFRLLVLPPAEVGDCFALDILSNLPKDKRVEQFCNYLLENYIDADSTSRPSVCSECTA
jgi:hypothetical protein